MSCYRFRHVFLIGGRDDEIKKKFQRTLSDIRNDFLSQQKDPSDSPNTNFIHDLVMAIKILEIEWSIEPDVHLGKNEPFIDIVIARLHQDNAYHFLLRHCVNLVDPISGDKERVCCGVLFFALDNVGENVQKDQPALTAARFWTSNHLVEGLKKGRSRFSEHFQQHFRHVQM